MRLFASVHLMLIDLQGGSLLIKMKENIENDYIDNYGVEREGL